MEYINWILSQRSGFLFYSSSLHILDIHTHKSLVLFIHFRALFESTCSVGFKYVPLLLSSIFIFIATSAATITYTTCFSCCPGQIFKNLSSTQIDFFFRRLDDHDDLRIASRWCSQPYRFEVFQGCFPFRNAFQGW